MKNLKKIVIVILCLFFIINIIADINSKQNAINEIEKEYVEKVILILYRKDDNLLKLRKQKLLLERQIELKRKDAQKKLKEHLVKIDEYIKKKDNPLTKRLYEIKAEKLAYIHEHGSLNGFELILTKDEIEINKEVEILERKIHVIEQEINEIDKSAMKVIKEHPICVQYEKAKKLNSLAFSEYDKYEQELRIKQYPKTALDYKLLNEWVVKAQKLDIYKSLEMKKEFFKGKRQAYSIKKQLNHYKIISDDKYNKLKENYNEIKNNLTIIHKKFSEIPMVKNISKEIEALVGKKKTIMEEINTIEFRNPELYTNHFCKHSFSKEKIKLIKEELSGLNNQHKHTEKCTHNH